MAPKKITKTLAETRAMMPQGSGRETTVSSSPNSLATSSDTAWEKATAIIPRPSAIPAEPTASGIRRPTLSTIRMPTMVARMFRLVVMT